jgi:hypothetical protein
MTQSTYRKPRIGGGGNGGPASFAALMSEKDQAEERTSYPGLLVPRGADSPSSYPKLVGAPHVSGCAGTWRSIT